MIFDGDSLRRLIIGFACLSVTSLLSGCHHRQMPPLLPAVILTPNVPPPTPVAPPMESSFPDSISTAPIVKVTQARPKKVSRKIVQKGASSDIPSTAEETTVGLTPEAISIGELSAGDDANPKIQQEATELIGSCEHRLSALSQTTARTQQSQVRKVRYFLKQAKQALSTGDIEGAKTLATKAGLLMDDLEK